MRSVERPARSGRLNTTNRKEEDMIARSFRRKWIISIPALFTLLLLVACGQTSQQTDQALKNATDTLRAKIMEGGCNGCKEFQITCTRDEQVSRADRLNGITGRRLIGMSYVYFDEHRNKYTDNGKIARFVNKSGIWIHDGWWPGLVDRHSLSNCPR